MKIATLATCLSAILFTATVVKADSFRFNSSDNYYNLDQIAVDGQFSQPQAPRYHQAAPSQQQARQVSPSDRMRQKRIELERQNELMVQKMIEDQRYQKELILMKQMQESMKQVMDSLGQIGQ